MSAAVVVPNSDDRVATKLLERLRVIGVSRDQVHIGLDAHVEKPLGGPLVALREALEVLGLSHLDRGPDSGHALLEVGRVAKVVEGHRRVVLRVGAQEAEVSRGERPRDLLEDETPLEGFPGYVVLVLYVLVDSLSCPLLWRDSRQLSDLIITTRTTELWTTRDFNQKLKS